MKPFADRLYSLGQCKPLFNNFMTLITICAAILKLNGEKLLKIQDDGQFIRCESSSVSLIKYT